MKIPLSCLVKDKKPLVGWTNNYCSILNLTKKENQTSTPRCSQLNSQLCWNRQAGSTCTIFTAQGSGLLLCYCREGEKNPMGLLGFALPLEEVQIWAEMDQPPTTLCCWGNRLRSDIMLVSIPASCSVPASPPTPGMPSAYPACALESSLLSLLPFPSPSTGWEVQVEHMTVKTRICQNF